MGHLPVANPHFSGDATAATAAAGDNDTSVATTAFVTAAITAAGAAPSNCLAYRSAALNHTSNGSYTVVGLDAEIEDTGTMHDNATNNSRIVAPTAGLYLITAQTSFAGNATGIRGTMVRLNAAGAAAGGTLLVDSRTTPSASNNESSSVSIVYRLAANDYVEMFGLQSAAASLAYGVGAGITFLSLTRLGS